MLWKVDVEAIERRNASQLAALEQKAKALQEKLQAEGRDREDAIGRLKREQDTERERVTRAIAELKKKLDRCGRSCMQILISTEHCICRVQAQLEVQAGHISGTAEGGPSEGRSLTASRRSLAV